MTKLSETEIQTVLASLPQWKLDGGKLVRDWTFPDFATAMAFVNRIAEQAETVGHHPDIEIRYNRVRLGLVTHDAGGITAKDAAMAATLDQS